MLKNLFKSAKQALKNPIVQLGIGALIPGSSFATNLVGQAGLKGLAGSVLTNPALLQGGIGLLAGDKPANVARNIGIQALLGGFRGMGEGGPGFVKGAQSTFGSQIPKDVERPFLNTKENRNLLKDLDDAIVEDATKGVLGTGLSASNVIDLAQIALPFALAKMAKDDIPQVEAQDIGVGNQDEYRRMLEASRFQNTGGIAGYAKGGEKLTSIGINSLTGEPSGMVTGPGTGKSDSIRFTSGGNKVPTDISNGEFIFTKRSVDEIGPDKLYAMMNDADPESETKEEGDARMAMA